MAVTQNHQKCSLISIEGLTYIHQRHFWFSHLYPSFFLSYWHITLSSTGKDWITKAKCLVFQFFFFFFGGCFQTKQLYRLNWCYLYKQFFCSFFLLSSTGCPMSKQEVLFSFAVIISDMLLATLSFRFFLLSSRRHFPHGRGKKKHSAFKQGNKKQSSKMLEISALSLLCTC